MNAVQRMRAQHGLLLLLSGNSSWKSSSAGHEENRKVSVNVSVGRMETGNKSLSGLLGVGYGGYCCY